MAEKSSDKRADGGGVVSRLLEFAGNRRPLFVLGCVLVAASMVLGMVPYVAIWQVVDRLVQVAPNWGRAESLTGLACLAFGAAMLGILLYFMGLMCTHLVAFRIQTNITKEAMRHLMGAPLGYFDSNASGMLRRRVITAGADVEQLLAHNIADLSGTVAMLVTTIVLLFVFDWRMGFACMLAIAVSIAAMASMMGGDNAEKIVVYQRALDTMSKASTEYVRGMPVVKVFQQTALSFRTFREAVDDYSRQAEEYQRICEAPQSVNLTFTEGVFVFLVPVAIVLAPTALADGSLASFVVDFAFYAVFSAVMTTSLAKVMFAAGGLMQADGALARVEEVLAAPQVKLEDKTRAPQDASIEFESVTFTYEGAERPAVDGLTFRVEAGSTVALVGPSGGGKTTAASMIPRFWDADSGVVRVGGVDVRDIDPCVLMDRIAFVFQGNRLFKGTILQNVLAGRPEATREEALEALAAAQCADILDKLPQREDTPIGTGGTYLSGGEAQRVLIARAMLKDAPIVVLDEATAFADPENEVLIQRAFARLARGRTVVIIAHRLSTVATADQIVVLDRGRVVERGTHQELLGNDGLYARMWADYQRAAAWRIAREVA